MNYAALGLTPPVSGQANNTDPEFEARWFLTVHLKKMNVREIKRLSTTRWAGISLLPLRPWIRGGPNPSSYCIVTGAVWTGEPHMDDHDATYWEYPDFEAAKLALSNWNGIGEPEQAL
jgi:hypothetical protein